MTWQCLQRTRTSRECRNMKQNPIEEETKNQRREIQNNGNERTLEEKSLKQAKNFKYLVAMLQVVESNNSEK